jgi:SAM-dependent methyltransferase
LLSHLLTSRVSVAVRRASQPVLACPLGKAPLCKDLAVIGNVVRENRVSADGVCYPVRDGLYADLLPASGRRSPLSVAELGEEIADLWTSRVQTGLFRSPLTAFLYERGWRQGFANAGFPGIDKEFEEVSEFFAPAASGGVVVDMSCGSGLMTRRLVRSGSYARVLALDYSEAMLRETARRVQEEGISTEALTLCRADVAALPLQAASVDAIHAGAAMHCWPRLEEGLRELRAALKPGGRYFATTFFQGAYGVPVREGGGGSFRFFKDEAELKELLVAAGFEEDKVVVRREGTGCAVVRAEA